MARSDMDLPHVFGTNVVALPGQSLPLADGNADSSVVDALERWLSDAKSGHLVAVAIAGVRCGHGRGTDWVARAEFENDLGSAIMALNARFSAFLNGAEPR